MFLGVDLAWGERNPDGSCLATLDRGVIEVAPPERTRGDTALIDRIRALPGGVPAILAFDAPVVCRNPSGSRPVDRESHRVFGRWKCGCHPVNLRLAARPIRLADTIRGLGFRPDPLARRALIEVYPHPAIVAWLGLSERIPYKRGPVSRRRAEFARLLRLLRRRLPGLFPSLRLAPPVRRLLDSPWSKPAEDQVDALLCALIAAWHHIHDHRLSQVLGDTETGFLVTPTPGGQFPLAPTPASGHPPLPLTRFQAIANPPRKKIPEK